MQVRTSRAVTYKFTAPLKCVTVRGMSSLPNPYDRVLYPGGAHAQTHPDRLASVAILYGMEPSNVECCRVLEIGCGQGDNLLPMAFGLTSSEFLGIDLAGKPIEMAQTDVGRFGLKNIHFQQMDLMDVGPDLGRFDYIIAHGIYSWVPAPVQDKLLTICDENLGANGVAFISYNVNPGGHVRRMLREMMQFHTRHMEDSEEQAHEGAKFLNLVFDAMSADTPFRKIFQEELERMSKRSDSAIYHDELAPEFSSVDFAEFVERAARHRLQFLSEVELGGMIEVVSNPWLPVPLKQLADGDLIAYQQYLDFVRFRWFRQTLLCHVGVSLDRNGFADRLKQLFVASPLALAKEHPDGVGEFRDLRGPGAIKTNNPAMIAALQELEQVWPRAERFDEILKMALAAVSEAPQSKTAEDFSTAMLTLAAMTLVDLRTYELPLAKIISKRPTASLLARLGAKDNGFVTTQLHRRVKLGDELSRKFVQLLDGTRDREALAEVLGADNQAASREEILKLVDGKLADLYRMGLLVA